MSKKYLTKNEFRMDNNPKHFGKEGKPHPAYITIKYKHKYLANSITHSRKTSDGFKTHYVGENPDKLSKDKRESRISDPFWQGEDLFSKEKLGNFRYSHFTRVKIRNINKKRK